MVPLEISFRAAEPLLQAVDAVFRHDGGGRRRRARRQRRSVISRRAPDRPELVELWPPVLPESPRSRPTRWRCRSSAARKAEPRTRLARAIAATIAAMARRRRAAGGARPRDAAGRRHGAGAPPQRLCRRAAARAETARRAGRRRRPAGRWPSSWRCRTWSRSGRFLLLPEDDLTLATVLKGPLFGIAEDELFVLAYDRGERAAVAPAAPRCRRNPAPAPGCRAACANCSARADFVPPFELYAEILGAGGGRRAMLERLGPEAADPIEEFLALALAYEREHVPSLQGFLRWLAAGDIEVKRDFGERQRDEVRILTVHGAKGLEAPVVFLPDTMQLPNLPDALLVERARRAAAVASARASLQTPFYDRAQNGRCAQRQLQEYRRLLYVALTRAQDRLYVCGWQTRRYRPGRRLLARAVPDRLDRDCRRRSLSTRRR